MRNDETRLWTCGDVECVMVSCCSGAELQIRRHGPSGGASEDTAIVLRELYPTKSDLYERARVLEAEMRASRGRSR
jgi:hypothetical protein